MVVGDILDKSFNILSSDDIVEKFNISINFLEYHSLRLKSNGFLEFQEKPLNGDIPPRRFRYKRGFQH